MKNIRKIILLIFIVTYSSCDTEKNKSYQLDNSNQRQEEKEIEEAIDKNLYKTFSISDYFSDRLLIGKKTELAGYASLNIKGFRSYGFDENGNITSVYDITNNYSLYSYDKLGRLIKAENRQHNPPQIYNSVNYYLFDNDSGVIRTKIQYTHEATIENTSVDTLRNHDNEKVISSYFKRFGSNEYFIDSAKNEIIAYSDKLAFCCGNIMDGKNKLIYFFNDDQLIDSLKIMGLESGKIMTLEYEYEKNGG